jgi:uncharacterized membrane protein YhaH (DUF805 family)
MKLFAGRMNRSTFLLVVLTVLLAAVVLQRPGVEAYLDAHDAFALFIVVFVALPLLIWQFATGARRLHDIGMSGWLSVLLILPGMQIFLLLMPGTKGQNKYGPQPTQTLDLTALLTDISNSQAGK